MTKNKKQNKTLADRVKKTALAGFAAGVMAFSPQPEASAEEVQKEIQNPSHTVEQVETQQDRNFIYSQDPKVTASGDGILAKSYVQNLVFTPETNMDLNSLFYTKKENLANFPQKSGKRDLKWKVSDSQEALENIENYLDNQEGELTGKEKAFKNHLSFLKKYASENPSNPETIKKLNKALEDGVFDVQADSLYNPDKNQWNVEKGTYMLIAKDKENSESVPILADLSTYYDKSPDVERKGLESELYGDNLNVPDLDKITLIRYHPQPEKGVFEDAKWSVMGKVTAGDGFNGFGAGLKYGPIAGFINIYDADDETTKDVQTQASSRTGRYGAGTEKNVDPRGIGIDLEWHPQRFLKGSFVGVGGAYLNYDKETEERIHASNGDVLAENSDSRSESDTLIKGYVGYAHPITDNLSIRGEVGYSSGVGEEIAEGFFGGLGVSYEFGNKK